MILEALHEQLKRHEGVVLTPYKDMKGNLTIGVGRNLDAKGISESEAFYLLDNDIRQCVRDLDHHLPWWRKLDNTRQNVLINMCFNMGIMGLIGFQRMLVAMKLGDYEKAHDEMLHSLWASQVGIRADELADQMLNGV